MGLFLNNIKEKQSQILINCPIMLDLFDIYLSYQA
nr:MAG TPA: hypothetical protein [Caudoviricetes sp.]DAZ34035.1 MAG TPA: hypothetical protein [Caudoviricetes sp.]